MANKPSVAARLKKRGIEDWEIKNSVDTLIKAEEIRNDKDLMVKVKEEFDKRKKAMDDVKLK